MAKTIPGLSGLQGHMRPMAEAGKDNLNEKMFGDAPGQAPDYVTREMGLE